MTGERDDRVAQLRKGVLELAILALLRDGPAYGGELVDRLAARPGLAAGAGTVYPLLARLKKAEAVLTTWEESPVGPPRKYYRLSPTGRAALADLQGSWRALAAAMDAVLEDETR